MTGTYHALLDAVVGLHFAFLGYVVAGGFFAWRRPWTALPHAGSVLWGLSGLAVPVPCPLTNLENALRTRAGEPPLHSGFIDQYVQGVLFPARLTPLVQVLVAATIAVSWIGAYARWRTRHARHDQPGRRHHHAAAR